MAVSSHPGKSGTKPRRLADGGGLYLFINATGKYCRWKYRFQGKKRSWR